MDAYKQFQDAGFKEPLRENNFLDSLVEIQLSRQLKRNSDRKPIFYDRSALCTLALCMFMGKEPSQLLKESAKNMTHSHFFEREVFFIQSLGFIHQDEIRTLNYEQALAFAEVHRQVYSEHGYRCIEIEAMPVEERSQKILQYCKQKSSSA